MKDRRQVRHSAAATVSPSEPISREDNNIQPISVSSSAVGHGSLDLALAAARVADENRGRDIVVLDTRKVTTLFDFFVIVTGRSRRQLHAIADEISRTLKQELGERRYGIEGYDESRWVLLDYGDVVVHVFDEEAREYYDLEGLWSGATRVPFEPAKPQGDFGIVPLD